MTKSLFAAQQLIPASPGNPDSEGDFHTTGQAKPCACLIKPGRWVLNPYCSTHKGLNMFVLAQSVQGSEVLASQAPSDSPESKPFGSHLSVKIIEREPSGQQLKQHGIKQVSGHNKEWMDKCIGFINCYPELFESPFTGEDIRHFLNQNLIGFPSHPNAYGALINALVRKGLIKFTGVYVTPKDRSSHARQIKQYVRT